MTSHKRFSTRFATTDQELLAADVRVASGSSVAAVVAHGLCSNRKNPAVTQVADALAAAGHTVITYDARGHGESTGTSTLGDLEKHDVAAAVDAARRHADRVVVVGASMGAVAALRHAVEDDELLGLVTVSCPAAWRLTSARTVLAATTTQTVFGRAFLARATGTRIAPGRPQEPPPQQVVPSLRVRLAIIHGRADRFVPVADASVLARRAGAPVRVELVPRMGHAYDIACREHVVSCVSWCIQSRSGDR
jgi:pimeloyl-ACP methyl ester carboxylesterase